MKKKLHGADPVQRVQSVQPMDSTIIPTSSPVTPAAPPVVKKTTTPSVISEREVLARWPEFVNEVRRHRISLGSVLESATFLGVSGGALRLRCANEFQASSIKRNKELLSEIAHKVFGIHTRCEVEIQETGQQQPVSGQPNQQGVVSDNEHPVIKAMIKELGAEPL
jgi:hypothetical protein